MRAIDIKTVKQFKEGDAEAFDIIYRLYSNKMFLFAKGLVKDQDHAKDLVHEVFVNLWERPPPGCGSLITTTCSGSDPNLMDW